MKIRSRFVQSYPRRYSLENKMKSIVWTFFIAFILGFVLGKAVYSEEITASKLGKIVQESDFVYIETSDQEIKNFLAAYPNTPFEDYHISYLNKTCKRFNVGVIWALSRSQTEQGIVINLHPFNTAFRLARCMAYNLISKQPPVGFENQIFFSIQSMREWADQWKPGMKTYVQGFGMVECKNAAVFSLHKYNCIWGAASNYGVYNIGNELFIQVLRQFQARWPAAQKLASQN